MRWVKSHFSNSPVLLRQRFSNDIFDGGFCKFWIRTSPVSVVLISINQLWKSFCSIYIAFFLTGRDINALNFSFDDVLNQYVF